MKKLLIFSIILALILNIHSSIAAASELFTLTLYSDANLLSYYRLVDGADTEGIRNFTSTNIVFQAGKFGNAAFYNGTTASSDTSTVFTEFSNATGSISIWFNTTSTGAVALFQQTKINDAEANMVLLKMNGCAGGGDLCMVVSSGGTNLLVANESVTGWNNGAWHNFIFTVSSTGNLFYVDGVLRAVTYYTGNATTKVFFNSPVGANNWGLGSSMAGASRSNYFRGFIDDVAVFNRALTPVEVECIALGTNCADLPASVKKASIINFE